MTGPLDVEWLRAQLERLRSVPGGMAGPVGRRVEHHDRIASTSDRARELAARGEPEGTVVLADEQEKGRGRAARSWHSPARLGVYMSVILRPCVKPADGPLFGLLAAVATAEGVGAMVPAPARIKWPNDVMLHAGGARRKVAGILAETRTTPGVIRDLVLGIGVNVNQTEADFPPDLARTATSLRIACGRPLERAAVAAAVLTAIDRWYTLWSRDGVRPVLDAYRRLADDLEGRKVLVGEGKTRWSGTTAGITAEGALLVVPESGSGPPVAIRYGDVTRLESET